MRGRGKVRDVRSFMAGACRTVTRGCMFDCSITGFQRAISAAIMRAERVRRDRRGLGAFGIEARLQRGCRERAIDLLVQERDHGRRRASRARRRRTTASPRSPDTTAAIVGTSGRLATGFALDTASARSLPALTCCSTAGTPVMIISTCPPITSVDRRRRALVRDVLDVGLRAQLEVLHRDVRGAAVAARRVAQRPRLRLRERDSSARVRAGHGRIHHEHVRHARHERDRREAVRGS